MVDEFRDNWLTNCVFSAMFPFIDETGHYRTDTFLGTEGYSCTEAFPGEDGVQMSDTEEQLYLLVLLAHLFSHHFWDYQPEELPEPHINRLNGTMHIGPGTPA